MDGQQHPIRRHWEATFTRRWHRHPHLAATNDPIAGHQGRVALIALMLWPDDTVLLRHALVHDMGEAAVGDVAWPVKQAAPKLAEMLDRLEAQAISDLMLLLPTMDDLTARRLKLCDRLDAIFWAFHHFPHLRFEPELMNDVQRCWDQMESLGVGHHRRALLWDLRVSP